MRLDLRAHLVDVKTRTSVHKDRPLVGLTFEVTGQPELPPLVSLYVTDHPVGVALLHRACESLGVPVTDLGHDHEAYATELRQHVDDWQEVTLEVEVVTWQRQDRLHVRRVRSPRSDVASAEVQP